MVERGEESLSLGREEEEVKTSFCREALRAAMSLEGWLVCRIEKDSE